MNGWRFLRALRWVLVAGSIALAVILLARRDYILGFLIGGLAVVRVVFLVGTARRRGFYPRGGFYGGGMQGPMRAGAGGGTGAGGQGTLRGLMLSEFVVAAGVIGIDLTQARDAYRGGSSLAKMASDRGVPVDQVVSAIVKDAGAKIERAVEDGTMERRFAYRLKARLPVVANRFVNHHKRDLQRT
jgi:hypothetical protein